jgi:hypothetical protein
MNDFTKEELEYIYDELDSNYSELKNIPLMKKIQSMIDTYCEHEPSDTHYEQFRWQLCQKCGVQYK